MPPPSSSSTKTSASSTSTGRYSSSSTSSSASSSALSRPVSFFPTPALDHAFAGVSAGAVATVCMNPLDLIKVQFQVDTTSRRRTSAQWRQWNTYRQILTGGKVAQDMYGALRNIVQRDGWTGLYRGLAPNVVGNSASWGLYFLFYTMAKESMSKRQAKDATGKATKLSATQHLLAASASGGLTALMTNPVWVVKTRMFTTPLSASASTQAASPSSSAAVAATSPDAHHGTQASTNPYRSLLSSLSYIYRTEGVRGLWKGGGLALVGVSNGAIQFMAYEQLKRYRSDVALRKRGGKVSAAELGPSGELKLSNIEYVIISGAAKVLSLSLTYPYQVVRSRIQNHSTAHLYPSIPKCISLTYKQEGATAFYKGMTANLVRIIPATCVTFVVYENVSWGLREIARRRESGQTDSVEVTVG